MLVGYGRISTDKQTIKNRRFEILNFVDKKRWVVEKWVEETVGGTRNFEDFIREMLEKKISVSAIGRLLGVHHLTVHNFED